jgi:hypothetical protein
MRVLIAVLVLLALIVITGHAEESPFVVECTIKLADVRGRIDHMAIDLGRRRLSVAELGDNSVAVIDLAAGKVPHRVGGSTNRRGWPLHSAPTRSWSPTGATALVHRKRFRANR